MLRLLALGLIVTTPLPAACQDVIASTPPADAAKRREAFDARNHSEQLKALVRQLSAAMDNPPETFTAHAKAGRYGEALDAYRDYFLAKLRDPEAFGVPALCVPVGNPDPAETSLDKNLQCSTAADLMRNIVTVRDLRVDVGDPGAINWTFVPPGWEGRAPRPGTLEGADYHTGDIPMLPRTEAWRKGPADFGRHFRQPVAFNALLDAYAKSGDAAYLHRWADYMDDWCINQKKDADASPHNIMLYLPQEIERFEKMVGNLAYLARNCPKFAEDLPAPTLARFLLRRLPESSASSIRQLRYFESNWRYFVASMLIRHGLLFDEFAFSEMMIREGRRGNENALVVCALPDGTEYELTPNYWGTTLSWASQPMWDLNETGALDWMTSAWMDPLKHHTWLRARAVLGHLMPSGHWPIIGPQDLRLQLSEYDRPAIRNVIPEFLNEPDTARRLNRAFGDNTNAPVFGDGSTALPSHESEWFPYGGFYFMRGGWERDDHFAFMKSSGHVIGHGGPFALWQNNNVMSLHAFGQELLFVHHVTPVTVDGLQQNVRDGLPYSGHMGYMLPKKIHPDPMPARWHTSDQFDFAEGTYDGSYGIPGGHIRTQLLGQAPPVQVRDVTHRRQVLFVKEAGLWIVTDRLSSTKPHDYSQLWLLHIPEESKQGPIYGFTEDQVEVDLDAGHVKTHNPNGPNVSLYQVGSSALDLDWVPAPPNPKGIEGWTTEGRDRKYIEHENYLFAYTISRVMTKWTGTGEQILVSVIYPRKKDGDSIGDLTRVAKDGVYGFDLSMTDGRRLAYRVGEGQDRELSVGEEASAKGEALLVMTATDGARSGMILGGSQLTLAGNPLQLQGADAEFAVTSNDTRTTPVYVPIEPVRIYPDRTAFVKSLDVTLTSATPSVHIHYTLDGSDPTPQSPEYVQPLRITKSATIKARAFRSGVKAIPPTYSGTHATQTTRADFTKQPPRPAATVSKPTAPGLSVASYRDEWQKLLLGLEQLTPVKTGTCRQPMDTSLAKKDTYFALKYSGWLDVPETGIYTFYAPDPMYDPSQPARETGYDVQVSVDGERWYPGTAGHGFGSWSIALEQGLHEIVITYADFRGGKEDMYVPNVDYGCLWQGDTPDLLVSGPGFQKRSVSECQFVRRK